MAPVDLFINSLLFIIPLAHLLLSPHTKVEESFNLQATHDILVYGTPTADVARRLQQTYDHFTFPGAVPRTFVGPVVLAGLSQPVVALVGFRHAQLVVRAVLGLFNAAALLVFKNALAAAAGRSTARWWAVLTMSQFHVVYYLTRTLPNMFAFGLTTVALAFLLPNSTPSRASMRRNQALAILTFAGVVFRSEIAILLFSVSLHLLLTKQIRPRPLVKVGIVSFLGSLLLSVPIDSYFWQKPCWPELWGFYFNAIRGSSSDWGVSPWHYYFTSALPRILMNPFVFALIGFSCLHPALSPLARASLLPSLLYIAIYSAQPHKEARFIFYTIPTLTAAAALGANYLSSRYSKSRLYATLTLALALSVVASFAASTSMLLLSSLNYPGGDALNQLYAIAGSSEPAPSSIAAHADVLTCMTGLTLFGQNQQGLPLALSHVWDVEAEATGPVYFFDKTEKSERLGWPSFWNEFDYVLMEDTALAMGDWKAVGVVHGYSGIEVMKPGQPEPSAGEHPVLGLGAKIAWLRQTVRKYTGGWWIGPRMSPRISIMKQTSFV